MPSEKKKSVFLAVRSALAIIDWLYSHNPARYKCVYSFVNGSAHRRKDPAVILACVDRLLYREFNRPVWDVMGYLSGTLRKLEQEREAARSRRGEVSSTGEILGELMLRAQKKKEG